MKYECIIHVGPHKTATNWLQQQLYPLCLSHNYVPRELAREAFVDMPAGHWYVEIAQNILDRYLPFIICEEELGGNYMTAGLNGLLTQEVARRIKAYCDTKLTLIIISKRELGPWQESCWQQYVKEGGTRRMKHWVRPENEPRRYPGWQQWFDWKFLLNTYKCECPKFDIGYWDFDRFREHPETEVMRLLDVSGMECPPHKQINWKPQNQAWPWWAKQLARICGRFTREWVPYKHYFFHIPGWYRLYRWFFDWIKPP